MQVTIDHDMTVNYRGLIHSLKRDQVVDGPLAVWLAEDSGCAVTVLEPEPESDGGEDGPGSTETGTETNPEGTPPAPDGEGSDGDAGEGSDGEGSDGDAGEGQDPQEATEPEEQPEQDGSLTADLEAASSATAGPKSTGAAKGAKAK